MGSGSGTEAEDIPTYTAKSAVREQRLIDKSTLDRSSTSTALATASEEEEGSTEEAPASAIDSVKAREDIMATEGESADTVAPTAPTLSPQRSASPSSSLPPQSQFEEQNLPQQQESQTNETEQDTANTTDTGGSVSASECVDGQENHNNPTMDNSSNTDNDMNTLSSTPTKTGSDVGSPESQTSPTTTATPPESPSPSVSSPTSSTPSPPISSSSSKFVHHRATSRSHIPPFVYDPTKITLRFLFANKDGISVTIDCKPTDTVGEVKGALLSVWPKELPDCSGGDRLRLICMGKGMLMPDTRSLEDCQVPTFKTHATPVNVSIRPESAPVGSYPAQKSSLVGGAGGGRARSGAASRREARGNSGSNGGGGTRTGCSCVIS